MRTRKILQLAMTLGIFLSSTKASIAQTQPTSIEIAPGDVQMGIAQTQQFIGISSTPLTFGKARTLSAGEDSVCAVMADGTVQCWGDIANGLSSSRTPVTVSGLSGVVSVAAGGDQNCVLLSNGTVECWGYNPYGELGNGTFNNSATPVTVSGLSGVTAISSGVSHTCALLSNGTVECWGLGEDGELGNGSFNNSSTPVSVSGLSGVVAITAGFYHTCALLFEGTVQCWGYDEDGELGNGTFNNSATPVAVSGLSGVTLVSAGYEHTCALLLDGTAECWGDNSKGEFGNGTTTSSNTPVVVSGLSGATAITASQFNTCALLPNGTAECWGWNAYGELGNGTTIDSSTPEPVSGLSGVVQVAAGGLYACARLSDGTIQCWGLGDSNFSIGSYVPATVMGGDNSVGYNLPSLGAVKIADGPMAAHSCAQPSDGTVECWGLNAFGQLGNGTYTNSNTPVTVSGLTGVVQVSVGNQHTCGVLYNGTVECWGDNGSGQLGNGTTIGSNTPVAVSGLSGATQVSAGSSRTCALLFNGTVECWGDNSNGQLGNGTTTSSSSPVMVSGLNGVIAIGVGGIHTCALLSGGTVQCWGYGGDGELGNGSSTNSSTPVAVSGLNGVSEIAVGGAQTCALLSDGTVQCWGSNVYGGLGNGTFTNSSSPIPVTGLSGATSIAAGFGNNCVWFTDGTAQCWGYNGEGELGNGNPTTSSPYGVSTPVAVSGLSSVLAVDGGLYQKCALLTNGAVECWGDNVYGGLGNGTFTNSSTPVPTSALVTSVNWASSDTSVATIDSLSGLATGVGLGNTTITATYGSLTANVSLLIGTAPSITSAANSTFFVGIPNSFTVTTIGTPTPGVQATGRLPSGVTFDGDTGLLSGTPASIGTYFITFTAGNGISPSAVQNFVLTVQAGQAPAITSANNTAFIVGQFSTFSVTATGSPTPTLSETVMLPSGITFNAATGVLSGTPALNTGGTYALIFSASNGLSPNATQTFTLTVYQPAAPVITSANGATFTVDQNGSFTVTAIGFPPTVLTELGTLPGGVTFNASTGLLGGTPATGTAGTYSITFTASNGLGSGAVQSFSLIVLGPRVIHTVAGNGSQGYSGDGGPATNSQLEYPLAVAVDTAGNMYIADSGNNVIRVVNTGSSAITVANVTIPPGDIATVVGNLASSPNCGYSGDGGPASNAQLCVPEGVTLDSSGNIYFADSGNNVIRVVNTGSSAITVANVTIPPGDIATVVGNLASSPNCGYSGDGGPSTYAQLCSPGDVVLDGSGNVYISDTGNNAIRMVNTNGIIAAAAGIGAFGYNGDGIPAVTAELAAPEGIALDSSGNIYVADQNNQRIREVGSPTTGNGPAPVSIVWSTPQSITYGTALSGTQLNATASYNSTSVPGTFVYTPAAGTVLSAGNQGLSVTFTPTDTTDYATATASVTLRVNQATPSITWNTPSAVTYGTVLSAVQLNSTASYNSTSVPGTYVYTPVAGTVLSAGSQTLSVTFTPSDATDYATATASVMLQVNQATPTVSFTGAPTSAGFGTTFTVSATTNSSVAAVISASGACTIAGKTVTMTSGTGTCSLNTTWAADNNYVAASATQSIAATKIAATVAFTGAPANAPYEGTFSVTATTNSSTIAVITASGACSITSATVTITAPSGTCLLTATWAADNNYLAASVGQTTAATKATPTINWAAPPAITYGTALSGTQLNATATYNSGTVAGTFVYTPAKQTVLSAGNQTLSVSFTPTNTADYTAASASVTLQVNQATPKITWAKPTAITYGTALSSTQLDATASVPGTFVYSPQIGAVMEAGTQTLSVTFTPTDAVDYATGTGTVTITVNKAASTITWTTPSAITYGTALSNTQLDATASVAGTFVYSPPAGAIEAGGSDKLSVTFTPTDTTDYTTVIASVTLQVNPATPTINWATPSAVTYGTALSGTQLDATAMYNGSNVAGTYVYTPAKGTVLGAGTQTLSVAFTPSNAGNYTGASASVTLQVNPATPAITWAKPAAITYGISLSGTQLDASASVAGSFVYSPAAGTVLTAGADALSVTFTPTNTTDYTTATHSVTITVNQATSTTTITSNTPNPSLVGQSVTVSFSVTGSGVPTGTVTVTASSGQTCSGALSSGVGSCSLTFTASGSPKLTAAYGGDINFKSSTSAKVTQTVQP
jgi:alpha-tubulin suppressor-like RCC1 family protein